MNAILERLVFREHCLELIGVDLHLAGELLLELGHVDLTVACQSLLVVGDGLYCLDAFDLDLEQFRYLLAELDLVLGQYLSGFLEHVVALEKKIFVSVLIAVK